ncbi:MAG: hypothetical protein V4670_01290 [Bacteroidota bacterium]
MKTTIIKMVLIVLMTGSTMSTYSFTSNSDPEKTTRTEAENVRGQQLLDRLHEIKAIDRSELSREERKTLRKEVKAIKTELATDHRGFYISFGAAIIIVLLLILIL